MGMLGEVLGLLIIMMVTFTGSVLIISVFYISVGFSREFCTRLFKVMEIKLDNYFERKYGLKR